jgi:hypothetical protein
MTRPSGETIRGGEAAWEALKEMYAVFTAYYHEPMWYIIWETEAGYFLTGQAIMYGNFPVEGATKVKDLEGREWDFAGPGAFSFEYAKDPTGPKGLKLKGEKLCADGIGLVKALVARGMCNAEQGLAMAK